MSDVKMVAVKLVKWRDAEDKLITFGAPDITGKARWKEGEVYEATPARADKLIKDFPGCFEIAPKGATVKPARPIPMISGSLRGKV